MRMSIRWMSAGASVVLIALAAGACAEGVRIRTIIAPDARLTELQTFEVLPAPRRTDGRIMPADDPMMHNSIVNRALRQSLSNAFEARGYVRAGMRPDFAVALYTSIEEELDVTVWDYGYAFRPGWHRGDQEYAVVSRHVEGTVIVDVVDPLRRELLWRGRGVAQLTDDAALNIELLQHTISDVVARFPRAVYLPVALR